MRLPLIFSSRVRAKEPYRSSMSAEEVTSSWEEIVDMMAARMAASMKPATSGWKSSLPSVMKTVSGSASCFLSCWYVATPTMAVPAAPSTAKSIQPIPMVPPATASLGLRMAMNRTMMCG